MKKSYLRLYWSWFLAIVGVFVIAKAAQKIAMPHAAEDLLSIFVVAYFLLIWLPLGVVATAEGYRLTSYVRQRHDRNVGMLTSWVFPWFVHTRDNFGDPTVTALKENYRHVRRLGWVAFLMFALLGLFIAAW